MLFFLMGEEGLLVWKGKESERDVFCRMMTRGAQLESDTLPSTHSSLQFFVLSLLPLLSNLE